MSIRSCIVLVLLLIVSLRPMPAESIEAERPFVSAVRFTDPHQGWILVDGEPLRTYDGGRHWRAVHQPPPAAFFMDVISTTQLVLGTVEGIYATDDGGISWKQHTPILPNQLFDFFDLQHGWGRLGDSFVRTEDGGMTWKVVEGPCGDWSDIPQGPLTMIGPTDAWLICFMAGMAGHRPNILYQTSDNGQSWQEIDRWEPYGGNDQLPDWGFVGEICVVSPSDAWIATFNPSAYHGRRSTLLRSRDGGHRWSRVAPIPRGEVFYLSCTTAEQISMVIESPLDSGKMTAYGTWNGGATWKRLYAVHHFTR